MLVRVGLVDFVVLQQIFPALFVLKRRLVQNGFDVGDGLTSGLNHGQLERVLGARLRNGLGRQNAVFIVGLELDGEGVGERKREFADDVLVERHDDDGVEGGDRGVLGLDHQGFVEHLLVRLCHGMRLEPHLADCFVDLR